MLISVRVQASKKSDAVEVGTSEYRVGSVVVINMTEYGALGERMVF